MWAELYTGGFGALEAGWGQEFPQRGSAINGIASACTRYLGSKQSEPPSTAVPCCCRSVLGMGLLPSVDYAARHLLAPGARVLPQRIQASPARMVLPLQSFQL